MKIRQFIYVVLITLTGLIGCVGMDGGKRQTDKGDRSVLTQNYDFEGTGVRDYTNELQFDVLGVISPERTKPN